MKSKRKHRIGEISIPLQLNWLRTLKNLPKYEEEECFSSIESGYSNTRILEAVVLAEKHLCGILIGF